MRSHPGEPVTSASVARPAVWLFHMALPLLGLWLLVAHPMLDIEWLYQGAHFVYDRLPGRPNSTPLGALMVKGREQSVEAFILHDLTSGAHERD